MQFGDFSRVNVEYLKFSYFFRDLSIVESWRKYDMINDLKKLIYKKKRYFERIGFHPQYTVRSGESINLLGLPQNIIIGYNNYINYR